jgi:hypothetical protein
MSYEFIQISWERWCHHFPKPSTVSVWDEWLTTLAYDNWTPNLAALDKRREIARKYWGVK